MKKILSIAALSMLTLSSLLTTPAQAVGTSTATGTFDVTVNLTPKCEITTAPGNLTVDYISFQGTNATSATPFAVRCTTSLPYTMDLTSASGTLVGIDYTLAILDATNTVAAGGTGAGLTKASYKIKVTAVKNQPGTCTAIPCTGTSELQTLTITY